MARKESLLYRGGGEQEYAATTRVVITKNGCITVKPSLRGVRYGAPCTTHLYQLIRLWAYYYSEPRAHRKCALDLIWFICLQHKTIIYTSVEMIKTAEHGFTMQHATTLLTAQHIVPNKFINSFHRFTLTGCNVYGMLNTNVVINHTEWSAHA